MRDQELFLISYNISIIYAIKLYFEGQMSHLRPTSFIINNISEIVKTLPEYMQKICTDGNGEKMPMKKDSISVTDVIVMETAASESIIAIRSGTGSVGAVRLQAASITKVSSIPIPRNNIRPLFSSE